MIINKLNFLVILFLLAMSQSAWSITLVNQADLDFSHVQYDNRIRLGGDLNDPDFLSESSEDLNGDGLIDYLETQTFGVKGDLAKFYLGNEHNSYDVSSSLLSVGVDGTFHQFTLNGLTVASGHLIAPENPYFYDTALEAYLDSVIFFEIDQKIEDKEPNDSPVNQNALLDFMISDVISEDPSLRFYIQAYGAISSGKINSYTPKGSNLLFVPSYEEGAIAEDPSPETTEPVPEPSILLMCGLGSLLIFLKQNQSLERI